MAGLVRTECSAVPRGFGYGHLPGGGQGDVVKQYDRYVHGYGNDGGAMEYMTIYLFRRIPTVPGLLFFELAIWGLTDGIRRRCPAALAIAALCRYTARFACLTVFSDPRSRGATEPGLVVFAPYQLQRLFRRATRARAKGMDTAQIGRGLSC
jgi:hypothetical protein